jgi:hypothetical protein
MADYHTSFACLLPLGPSDNVAAAMEIYRAMDAEKDAEDETLGFEATHQPLLTQAGLFLSADEDGDPEHVIHFALRCAKAFNLQGQWGFSWALTCSRLRVDAFGGGAHLIDLGRRETIAWFDTDEWLHVQQPVLPAPAA